ncbi:pol polyprotein [Tanacetum coccineum]|uniref:Pol polyprotein n=1 Tax=Tanacetum coccineum TaxID=301880 RepID=A0ABQ4Y6M9_9ASTR
MTTFKSFRMITLTCDDGTNDVGAFKQVKLWIRCPTRFFGVPLESALPQQLKPMELDKREQQWLQPVHHFIFFGNIYRRNDHLGASKNAVAEWFIGPETRELRNELKYVQNGININEISCLKVRMTNETNVTAPVNVTGAPVTNTVANHAEKPEKFNGQNFKRWQQKMFFYLTTLNLARFLNETAPQVEPPAEGQPSNAQAVQAVEAWRHSDFLCHNYVLNGLVDSLYNVYCKTTTAKELWESLERKYKTEDAGTKKFMVARFLDYKMDDSKTVITQVQDLQVLLHDIHAEGMTLSETFQVAAIIEKLPPSWVSMLGSISKSNSKAKGKGKKKNYKKSKGKAGYLAPKTGIVKQNGWWVNTGEIRHVCADKSMFHSSFTLSEAVLKMEKRLYIGNSTTSDFNGEGEFIQKCDNRENLKLD